MFSPCSHHPFICFSAVGLCLHPELATEVALQFTEKTCPATNSCCAKEKSPTNITLPPADASVLSRSIPKAREITTAFYQPFQPVLKSIHFSTGLHPAKIFRPSLIQRAGTLLWNSSISSFTSYRSSGNSAAPSWSVAFSALKSRTLSMITETAEQRYATLLQTNPSIFEYAPLKHIASYLVYHRLAELIRKDFAKNRAAHFLPFAVAARRPVFSLFPKHQPIVCKHSFHSHRLPGS